MTRPLPNLHDFQRHNVRRTMTAKAICLNDGMGLGKTYCGLAHLQGLIDLGRADTCVVVTKKSVVNTSWKARLEDAFPHLTYKIITGDMPAAKRSKLWAERPLPDVFVCNFELMINRTDGLLMLNLFRNNRVVLIGDEVQYLRNVQTQRHQAWLALADKAVSILPMTGTPVQTSPMDFYGMLSAMRYPNLPNERKWILEWCNWKLVKVPAPMTRRGYHEIIVPLDFKKGKMQELREILLHWFIRNPPSMITLPPVREMVREIELTPHERKLYAEAEGKLAAARQAAAGGNDFALRQALKDALADHSEVRAICSGKRAKGVPAKDQELIDLLPELIADDRKVVVYSPFKESLRRLMTYEEVRDCNPVTIIGDDSGAQRGRNVQRFMTDQACRILFMSDAGAEGVDGLQAKASRIIFFDRIYNPAQEDQIFARVHRQGQTEEVLKIKFLTKGTIEETIDDKLLQRRDVMDVVDHLTRTELTDFARQLLSTSSRRK